VVLFIAAVSFPAGLVPVDFDLIKYPAIAAASKTGTVLTRRRLLDLMMDRVGYGYKV
jgi:hypothetical protein